MDRRAFEMALQAAAKIAFGASVATTAGCTGAARDTSDKQATDLPLPPESSASASAAPGRVQTHPEASSSCSGADHHATKDFEQEAFECCIPTLASKLPADFETNGFGRRGSEAKIDAAISNCCSHILQPNYDKIWRREPLDHPAPADVVTGCCVSFHGNAACTPWGPPVPPRMVPGDEALFA